MRHRWDHREVVDGVHETQTAGQHLCVQMAACGLLSRCCRCLGALQEQVRGGGFNGHANALM
eukprot:1850963-Amphidinium_carterae.1